MSFKTKDPLAAQWHEQLRALKKGGHHKEAIALARHGLDVYADIAFLINQAISTLFACGERELAMSELEKALVKFPSYPDVRNGATALYLKNNEPEKAIESARLGLKLDPPNATACVQAVSALMATDHIDEATSVLKSSQHLFPRNTSFHAYSARTFMTLNMAPEALATADRLVACLGSSLAEGALAVRVYAYFGEHEKACTLSAKLIKDYPDNHSPYIQGVRAYRLAGRMDEATACMRWINENIGEAAPITHTLNAEGLIAQHQFGPARQALLKAMQKKPNPYEAMLYLAISDKADPMRGMLEQALPPAQFNALAQLAERHAPNPVQLFRLEQETSSTAFKDGHAIHEYGAAPINKQALRELTPHRPQV